MGGLSGERYEAMAWVGEEEEGEGYQAMRRGGRDGASPSGTPRGAYSDAVGKGQCVAAAGLLYYRAGGTERGLKEGGGGGGGYGGETAQPSTMGAMRLPGVTFRL
eukprot:EG_transcript_23429